MRRVLATGCCAAGLVLALPDAAARADGGPVLPVQGGAGIAVGATHVVAVGTRRDTVLERVDPAGGAVQTWSVLHGSWGIPGASFDGATTGLAARAHRLVVAGLDRRYPPRRTRLLVLGTGRLRPRDRFTLRGFFTVDAISPSGRWLYLLHYSSARALRYEVRAYDVAHHRLLRRPVVDPREPDEKMVGLPLTRTMGPGDRWAYTLYQRTNGKPFIHALDTVHRRAVCVDLDRLGGLDLSQARISVVAGGRRLRLSGGGATPASATLATVDTRTWRTALPRTPAPRMHARPPHRPPATEGAGTPWWPAPVAALLALVAAAGLAARRRAPA